VKGAAEDQSSTTTPFTPRPRQDRAEHGSEGQAAKCRLDSGGGIFSVEFDHQSADWRQGLPSAEEHLQPGEDGDGDHGSPLSSSERPHTTSLSSDPRSPEGSLTPRGRRGPLI
jgi:hypothetical protein